jgi:hypothetical protein
VVGPGRRPPPGWDPVAVIDAVVAVLAVGTAVLTVWGLVAARTGRAPGRAMWRTALGLEVLLVGQAVVAVVGMATDAGPQGSTVLFVSYLVTVVLVLPIALVWAHVESDRWSSAVLAVAAFTVMAMVIRLWDVWRGGVQIGGPGA